MRKLEDDKNAEENMEVNVSNSKVSFANCDSVSDLNKVCAGWCGFLDGQLEIYNNI